MGEDLLELQDCLNAPLTPQKITEVTIKRIANGFLVECRGGGYKQYIAQTISGALQISKELMD